MRPFILSASILSLTGLSISTSCTPALSNTTTPALNLTAISAANGNSVLECWQLQPGFTVASQAGTSGALSLYLGDTANASYTILPPRFNGGTHNAPSAQYVVFLSGLAHVTLPNSTDEAWIQGGKYGAIIAVDTVAVSKDGHITTYPGDADTAALQIPFLDGKVPKHKVLYPGACQWPEMTGL
ncbi:hypothetical protein K490DRAFT_62282 [Saccharata proteae CBS 121410]|uniref:Small secreted protein n=1 Tax=Saccharata proteae CBS 121410 TaxID=1314787 RepID=A0A9P4HXA5_9PEZI|nr:hypothetical protein K490DRAFT_62282 [Saccharata proteae CBS 121410]